MPTTMNSSGITFPDGTTLTTANDTASIAATGWQKLPGGLIIQWGQFNVSWAANNTNSGSGSSSFATAFPNACLGVFASGGPCISSLTTSTTGISCGYDFLGYVPGSGTFPRTVGTTRYIVFGY